MANVHGLSDEQANELQVLILKTYYGKFGKHPSDHVKELVRYRVNDGCFTDITQSTEKMAILNVLEDLGWPI